MILQIEPQSPTWRMLKGHLMERIQALQVMLEAPSDREATATLRGQIKELRALIERIEPAINEPANTKTAQPFYS